MVFIPFDNVAQVETVFTQAGQICENVYHVHQSGTWDAAALNSIAATFEAWWKASIKSLVSNTLTLTRVKARDLSAPTAVGIELAVTTANVGSRTDQPLPNNATLAIKWSTGLTGRSYRGRSYHMGLVVGDVYAANPNLVQPTPLAEITLGYAALLTAVNIADQSLVVASRIAGGLPRALGAATSIQAVSVDSTLDSQRRRLPGRGA